MQTKAGTKVILGILGALTALFNIPGVHEILVSTIWPFVAGHPVLASLAAFIVAVAGLLHDPKATVPAAAPPEGNKP